ncbi:MAG: ABC transporter ATP-binding protein, partial [Dehalococcoidia bacterium]
MPPVIEARHLVKKYGDFLAVDSIDFSVDPGECFGFLGPNGAGKTSTLKMIGGVSPVSGGRLLVGGQDVTEDIRAIKAMLGVVPQRENLDPDLTVWQNLMVYARYFDTPWKLAQVRAAEALELMQLQERKRSPIATLSDGMKRRLLIARALLNQPRVLILDEPTTGLDPQARHLVWQKLDYLRGQGTTLPLSTHNMEEAAKLCDRLVIMHLGKIISRGRPPELVARYAGEEVLELRLGPEERQGLMAELEGLGVGLAEVGDTLYLFHRDGAALRRRL